MYPMNQQQYPFAPPQSTPFAAPQQQYGYSMPSMASSTSQSTTSYPQVNPSNLTLAAPSSLTTPGAPTGFVDGGLTQGAFTTSTLGTDMMGGVTPATTQQQQQYVAPTPGPHSTTQAVVASTDPSSTPAPPDNANPMFACLIPGRPVKTDFVQVAPTRLITSIPDASGIKQIALTLLRPELPEGSAVGVFFACSPEFKDWNYLGSLSNDSPTAFYRAAWNSSSSDVVETVQLGLALESVQELSHHVTADQVEEKKTIDSVKAIANDLYHYMNSFSQQVEQVGEYIMIPTNCVDKWINKFQEKHRKTPFFWLK